LQRLQLRHFLDPTEGVVAGLASISSDVTPQIREYERTMTTVLNAFTGIRVAEYTERIERELAARGLREPVAFMQGFGGTLSAAEARQRPITLIDSGPAGGVIGARALANRIDQEIWKSGSQLPLFQSSGAVAVRATVANYGAAGYASIPFDWVQIGFTA